MDELGLRWHISPRQWIELATYRIEQHIPQQPDAMSMQGREVQGSQLHYGLQHGP